MQLEQMMQNDSIQSINENLNTIKVDEVIESEDLNTVDQELKLL